MKKRRIKVRPYWTNDKNAPCSMDIVWNSVPADILATWKTSHKNLITKAFVGYIMRIYTFVDVCRILKPVNGSLVLWRELRLIIVQNFNTALGLKLMLLRCQLRKMNGLKIKIEKEIRENKIFINDAAIFENLNKMDLEVDINNKIKLLPNKIPTAKDTIADCQQCIHQTKVFFGKFVTRKHSFIFHSNNLQHSDILNELYFKVIESFFLSTPFLTPEHRLNTIKRAGHNHGIKLIKYYTAPERARTRRTKDGFENVIQVMSDSDNDDEDHERGPNSPYKNITFESEKTDNLLSLQSYIKSNPQNLPIIDLLSMQEDEGFVKFAEQENGYVFHNTENVYEELGSELYYSVISKYLKISLDKVTEVVIDLQNTLTLHE